MNKEEKKRQEILEEITISEVVFYPIRPTPKGLIGFISCTYNNQLALNSIAVYTRPSGNGIRILFPSRSLANGKTVSIYYPINRGVACVITAAIEKKINEVMEKVKKKEGIANG